jgi:predicted nucleic acid-binding protein
VKRIADTGVIVALLARNDAVHDWAADAFRRHAPFFVCDAVLSEAGSFFSNPVALLRLVARGDLVFDPDFVLADQLPRVLALVTKYADQPMDVADACIVRMTELSDRCKVWTVDRYDFTVYRRHGRQPVPCEFPPDH